LRYLSSAQILCPWNGSIAGNSLMGMLPRQRNVLGVEGLFNQIKFEDSTIEVLLCNLGAENS